MVERGLLQAEEKYLVEPGATLGTWFARVEETICVAARVTVLRIEEGRTLEGVGVAAEQRGLLADICAEAIRAAAVIWSPGPSPQVRAELLNVVSEAAAERPMAGFGDVLVALARCSAALEPLANGLREVDLPMGEPTDRATVGDCFLELAAEAFGYVHVMC
ncbi:MAG TPA: hypothetical protein VHA80_01080 [Solirubrobacterales bacterium]|nr:hypothetical protein [Solirubrobacterales bacterium]